MTMLEQVLIGLVLFLAVADAQDVLAHHDVVINPHANWSIEPRATANKTVDCSQNPRVVVLNPGVVATFTSPGYPTQYVSSSKCAWRFRSGDRTRQITVTCSSFSMEPRTSKGSCNDYLALGKKRYCGSTGPSSVSVTSRKLLILRFKSNKQLNYDGFSCTATVTGSVVTEKPVTHKPITHKPGKCVCGKANHATRIVGGQTTEANEYPWQVALVMRGSSSVFCGGSLINDRWVLTAAHCTQDGVQQVLLGNHLISSTDSGERRINVTRVVDHPDYNITRKLDNDFSLLELSESLDLEAVDPQIRPICLPTASNTSQYEDVEAIVSGWGTTEFKGSQPDALRDTTVQTQTNSQCKQAYGFGSITNSMICAAASGKDSCQGDSGGPLVRNVGGFFRLIGVVSWGYICADPRYPGVYARVTDAIKWITLTSSSGTTCDHP